MQTNNLYLFTSLFLMMSCSSGRSDIGLVAGTNGAAAPIALGEEASRLDPETAFSADDAAGEGRAPASRGTPPPRHLSTEYTGQAQWRIINFDTPDPDFDVNEDLTKLSAQGQASLDAFARISGILSAGGGNLLKVTPNDPDLVGPQRGALQQILANVQDLREKLKVELPKIRRIFQTVYFVPMQPDNRDLFHGYEKLSTEPGRANVDLLNVTPSNREFQQTITREIDAQNYAFAQRSAERGLKGELVQVLGAVTQTTYNAGASRANLGRLNTQILIALRPGTTPVGKKLASHLSFQEYTVPTVNQRPIVALITLNAGFGVGAPEFGELTIEFGEFEKFTGVGFDLKTFASPLNGSVNKDAVPKFIFNVDGLPVPDSKVYISRLKLDLGKLKVMNLATQGGLRGLWTIEKDQWVTEQANEQAQKQVDAALRGEMDAVILKLLGSGGAQ